MNVDLTREDVVTDSTVIELKSEGKKLLQSKEKVYEILKRIIDVVGALAGIVVLVPLTIGVSIAKLITNDKGPIFYTQNRIGKDGKNFKMYKFRSMVVGADDILQEYLNSNTEANEEYRINKKLKHDPRVTKVGEFIRKTSIDEFPQFINVLKGEMSLVGPRPYLPREIEDIGEYYPYITSVKPGITGLWQIRGRNDVTFNDRLKLDMEYFEKKNLLFETKILFWTVSSVVHKKGAK